MDYTEGVGKLAASKESPPLVEFCPRYHRAIEVLGRRWTGAVVRVLIGRPHRFNELLVTIPGLSDRLLTERLRELEVEGMVRRHVIAGPPLRVEYELTKAGSELEPAIRELANWAEKWFSVPDPSQGSRGPLRTGHNIRSS